MFSALAKAFKQATDPAFRKVFFITTAASLGVFAVLWALSWFGLSVLGESVSSWVADMAPDSWIVSVAEWIFGTVSVMGVLIASFFLFPSVMLMIMPLLLEDIAKAVERKHYPGLDPARPQPVGEAILGSLSFVGVTLLVNLLALPFYLIFLFFPPLNLILFYLINGYLLGREYFELVALRRFDLAGSKKLRKMFRGRVVVAGVVLAVLLTIPFLNVFMPIIATAFMLHVFEGMRQQRA